MAKIGKIELINSNPLVVIAGPCAIEEDNVFDIAEKLVEVCSRHSVPFIFKASYDKANRQSLESARGCGIDKGLEILGAIKEKYGVPVLTDVHSVEEVAKVAKVVDCIQIPAFLSRQTDLVVAVAKSGRTVNIKKGQFLSPDQMESIVEKAAKSGAEDIVVTERGASFGYNDLIFDPRSLTIMKEFSPVIFDATHSVQKPGSGAGISGGDRKFIETLVRAAVAVGIAGLFIETHPDPANALSDRETQWPLDKFEELLLLATRIDKASKC
ncbi:MAG: 3-deoxy-8-phosphooctulonate synthase [Candidatus Lindowbacteria bacterium]|nr:3-deoxy-8-phosphooctulonate synthase [Candidatus Lindowbacteria bacterium]